LTHHIFRLVVDDTVLEPIERCSGWSWRLLELRRSVRGS
jgi:hypothetical protein